MEIHRCQIKQQRQGKDKEEIVIGRSKNTKQNKEGKRKMQEKQYVQKCKIVEKVFDDGGSLLNVAVSADELKEMADENGWVNITIAKRREPSEKGATHYAYKNEFKPKVEQKDDSTPF